MIRNEKKYIIYDDNHNLIKLSFTTHHKSSTINYYLSGNIDNILNEYPLLTDLYGITSSYYDTKFVN